MFYYLGRKQRLAHLYPAPVYDHIIEPFAGSAAYALHADHWQRDVTLVELDPNTLAVWRYLQQATPADILTLPDVEAGQKLSDYTQLTEAEVWLMRYAVNPGSSQRTNTVTRFSRWHVQKPLVAASLHKIRHWTLVEGDYRMAPEVEATWFIDPPYHRSGKFYMTNDVVYDEVAEFSLTRRGQAIVCEQEGAAWLPFEPLRAERSARGTRGSEVVWTSEMVRRNAPGEQVRERLSRPDVVRAANASTTPAGSTSAPGGCGADTSHRS